MLFGVIMYRQGSSPRVAAIARRHAEAFLSAASEIIRLPAASTADGDEVAVRTLTGRFGPGWVEFVEADGSLAQATK